MSKLVRPCPNITVAYKPNRAIIFASSLFHNTEPFLFREGYPYTRGFMTMLFGHTRTVNETIALAPPRFRAAFEGEIARTVPAVVSGDNDEDWDDTNIDTSSNEKELNVDEGMEEGEEMESGDSL